MLDRLDRAGVDPGDDVLHRANLKLQELSGDLADQAQQASAAGVASDPPLLTRPHDWPQGR